MSHLLYYIRLNQTHRFMSKKIAIASTFLVLALSHYTAQARLLIPTDQASALYYQLGGARDVGLPATENTQTIDLDASLSR